jgi:acyl dehydratase
MTTTTTTIAELPSLKGQELGTSDWYEVTQDAVNLFADATGDHQWIHVDVERAKKESPFGGPIAHGFLTLSLLPSLGWQVFSSEGAKMGVNYGCNKVRFMSPVPVGSKVRDTLVLSEAKMIRETLQTVITHTIEIEGVEKPACVAESVTLIYF